MGAEVRVEHTYPDAWAFLRRHGPETLAVLHDLLAHAERRGEDLVAQTSVRMIAERLGFVSKDTVHRRIRQLIGAGVLRRVPVVDRAGHHRSPVYVVDLSATAISVTAVPVTAWPQSQPALPAPNAATTPA